MDQNFKYKMIRINDALIDEGKTVIDSQFPITRRGLFVDLQLLHKWWGKVRSFGYQLSTAAKPWEPIFSANPTPNTLTFAQMVLGTLEAIKHELENDHLERVTQLVKAETLADLLDQAEQLFESGYALAAGVIGRAVLEEHLRTLCNELSCNPIKKRPTIFDYNQALYSINHYSKTKMKQIDMLASVGNDSAHNKPDLDLADVKKMLSDLPELIESTLV